MIVRREEGEGVFVLFHQRHMNLMLACIGCKQADADNFSHQFEGCLAVCVFFSLRHYNFGPLVVLATQLSLFEAMKNIWKWLFSYFMSFFFALKRERLKTFQPPKRKFLTLKIVSPSHTAFLVNIASARHYLSTDFSCVFASAQVHILSCSKSDGSGWERRRRKRRNPNNKRKIINQIPNLLTSAFEILFFFVSISLATTVHRNSLIGKCFYADASTWFTASDGWE